MGEEDTEWLWKERDIYPDGDIITAALLTGCKFMILAT